MTFQLVSETEPKTETGPKTGIERKTGMERRRAAHARRRQNTAISRAGFDMLRLYRSNLEVRLRCIDEMSLQTENRSAPTPPSPTFSNRTKKTHRPRAKPHGTKRIAPSA